MFAVDWVEDPENVGGEGFEITCQACRWFVYLPPEHQDILADLLLRHMASDHGKRVLVEWPKE